MRSIFLSDYEGDFAVEKPVAATRDMAKNFLQRYQNYTRNPFYGDLASMLNNIDVNKNVTESVGNIKLEVKNIDQIVNSYTWTYIDENGNVANSKNVVLSYDRGRLKLFSDNWHLYKIADSKPKISSEEATAIAIKASKNFSYEVNIDNATSTVTGFDIAPQSLGKASLSYLNFPNQSLARGGDPYTLYPSWYVPLGFNKTYPGSVTGMTVSIWADTGEISIKGPMIVNFPSSFPDEAEASITSASIYEAAVTEGLYQDSTMFSSLVVFNILLLVVGVGALVTARKAKFARGRKLFSKVWGVTFCIIFLLTIIPIATAIPGSPNKSRIYASYHGQWTQEVTAMNQLAGQLNTLFYDNGYDVLNMAGPGTTKSNVLDYTQFDNQISNRAAVFHFGHLHQWNTAYRDNYNITIADTDIYPLTSNRKNIFVMIWVCTSAEYPNQGLSKAWTHRTDLNINAYHTPDDQGQTYIGFRMFSPIISGMHQTYKDNLYGPLSSWIYSFYYYALPGGYSVRDALDRASMDHFEGKPFWDSPLLNTNYAWYPGLSYYDPNDFPPDWYLSQMIVLGDTNIRLSPPYIVIDSVPHGTTTPSSGHYEGSGSMSVYANPSEGYYLDHWHVRAGSNEWNENPYNPLVVDFSDRITVTPVFASYNPQHYLNVFASNQYGDPYYDVSVWIDGQWRGYTGNGWLLDEGWHTVEVSGSTFDAYYGVTTYFDYWSDAGYYPISYNNPESFYIGSETTIYARYWGDLWLMGQEES